jgi:hypothetical protein
MAGRLIPTHQAPIVIRASSRLAGEETGFGWRPATGGTAQDAQIVRAWRRGVDEVRAHCVPVKR